MGLLHAASATHHAKLTFLSYLRFHPLMALWLGIVLLFVLGFLWSRRRRLPPHPYEYSTHWTRTVPEVRPLPVKDVPNRVPVPAAARAPTMPVLVPAPAPEPSAAAAPEPPAAAAPERPPPATAPQRPMAARGLARRVPAEASALRVSADALTEPEVPLRTQRPWWDDDPPTSPLSLPAMADADSS